jgi:hypothetical protein
MTSWAEGELERVLGPNVVATYNRQRGAGGEWDALRAFPLRQRQRLTSAGFFAKHGLHPDVAADYICARVGGVEDTDAAMRWWIRTATLALAERRRERHRIRHLRVAVNNGDRSYYARRQRLARQAGHASLYAYRLSKGWTENRTPRWRPRKKAA